MRRHIVGLFVALCGFSTAQAQAPPLPVNPALDAYATPQRLVKLADGRRIHLYCQGKGSPTVILTAGLGGWATSWAKVNTAIARQTRTCSWDRAGYGHSDPSPLPQTVANTTADLEGALAAAKIKGPYVLVGHSAGAFETLLFTDRHRADVVGMVLVDPSVPGQGAKFAAIAPAASSGSSIASIGRQRACAADIEAGTLKPDQARWATCFQYSPEAPVRLVSALKLLDANPARLRTKISLNENFSPNADAVVAPSRTYGDLPLIVLTQGKGKGLELPGASAEQNATLNAGWIDWHDDYARLSKRGVNLIVRDAGHGIQTDKPDAVIAAVVAVLGAARTPQRVQ